MSEILNLKEELQVDKKLEKIWSEYFNDDIKSIAPLFQEEMIKNSVTFLSLNPSLRPNNDAVLDFKPQTYPIIDYKKDIRAEKIPFFYKFYEIGENVKQPWTLLDLLYERDSVQSNLELKYNPKTISEKDKKFLQSQIKLTFEILENLNPKVVVVSNSWTEKFIHANLSDLGFIQEFPNQNNNYIYRINRIPFIINESKFLGSPQWYNRSKKDENEKWRIKKLNNEILRVINSKD